MLVYAMRHSRRIFVRNLLMGTGVGTLAISGWLAFSRQRAARWARRLLADARRRVLPAPAKPQPSRWSDNQITVSWLGHATVLINFYGIHILTDPALFTRVGVSVGLGMVGPKRYIAPALLFAELPPIDVLLLSHAHRDHLDLPSLALFDASTFTVTAKATADVAREAGLKNVTELSWGERAAFRNAKGDLRFEALEVKHWGERWPSHAPRGYNGYALWREGKALLFGGDTALTPAFAAHRSRGPFEVALMPIGAYRPWIWNHCTPEQALEMADSARARYVVPIHHQTFRLSDEPLNEPIQRLEQALAREPERLALRRIGETFACPA